MQSAATGFTFGEVVTVLAKLFAVNEAKRDTFVSRLQQLQKAGIPAGANSGRGVKVRYTAAQLLTLMTCLDLLDCGATPGTLASYFGDDTPKNLETLFSESGGNFLRPLDLAESSGMDLYFLFQPNTLGYLQSAAAVHDEDRSALLIEGDFKTLARLSQKPAITINMTGRLRALREVIGVLYPELINQLTFDTSSLGRKED